MAIRSNKEILLIDKSFSYITFYRTTQVFFGLLIQIESLFGLSSWCLFVALKLVCCLLLCSNNEARLKTQDLPPLQNRQTVGKTEKTSICVTDYSLVTFLFYVILLFLLLVSSGHLYHTFMSNVN